MFMPAFNEESHSLISVEKSLDFDVSTLLPAILFVMICTQRTHFINHSPTPFLEFVVVQVHNKFHKEHLKPSK